MKRDLNDEQSYGNLNPTMNRRKRRQRQPREFSNKKGVQLVVIGNFKYKKVFQRIGSKTIVHNILSHPISSAKLN